MGQRQFRASQSGDGQLGDIKRPLKLPYRLAGGSDPVGAEVPLANPYPAAQSYVDWKSTQPLFIEGGDPFDYTSGRTSMVYRYPKLSFNGELAMVVLVPVFS
jgi:hypothetical protein